MRNDRAFATAFTSAVLSNVWQLLVVFSLCLSTSGTPVMAQIPTLDDFRVAAASEGVNAIPYPNTRQKAVSLAKEVDIRKEGADGYGKIELLAKQNCRFV